MQSKITHRIEYLPELTIEANSFVEHVLGIDEPADGSSAIASPTFDPIVDVVWCARVEKPPGYNYCIIKIHNYSALQVVVEAGKWAVDIFEPA